QDMRALELGTQFDAVVCLFDSIGYVVTNEALAQVLQGVYRHLRPDGLFIFEFWHAAAMVRGFDPVRVARWNVPQGEIVRISETRLDCAAQIASVAYSIYELLADGSYSSLKETQVNRFFLLQEMSLWLSSSGFTPVKWFAGFQPDDKIDIDTWHIVAVARR